MDADRFSALTLRLTSRMRLHLLSAPSRRGLLAGLAGNLLAVLQGALHLGDATARKKKHKRKKKKRKKPAPPPPPGQADAFCPNTEESGVVVAPGNTILAQTFTAIARGWLVSAEVFLECEVGTEDVYLMQVATTDGSGFPTNDVRATTTISSHQNFPSFSTVTFTFPDPATVLPGSRYALVLTRPGPGDLCWRVHDSDACSTGAAFWNLGDVGDEWVEFDPPVDFAFATFVKP